MADNFLPGELLSYKRKLTNLNQSDLEGILKDLLRRDRLHPKLFPDIVKAVASSPYVPASLLADAIIATKSPYLQSKWETRIASEIFPDAVLKLMRASPTESLEQALCHRLTSANNDIRLTIFGPIAEVLSENGGAYSLETIESLLFELEPEGKVAGSVAQAILSQIDSQSEDNPIALQEGQIDGLMKHKVLTLLIKPLRAARVALRTKLQLMEIVTPASLKKPDEADKAVKRGIKHLEEAREEVTMGQREKAATQCRRSAEASCKAVWWAFVENYTMDDKPLEDIKQALKTRKLLTEPIEKAIMTVQQYSVYGAHDKVYEKPLSDDVVKACVSETEKVSDWAARVVDERNLGHLG